MSARRLAQLRRHAPKPPKSVRQLAREQGLPKKHADLSEIAAGIWRTPEDVAEFEALIRSMRQGSKD